MWAVGISAATFGNPEGIPADIAMHWNGHGRHAAMYLHVRDGHISRIEEYLDYGKRASIRAARKAPAG